MTRMRRTLMTVAWLTGWLAGAGLSETNAQSNRTKSAAEASPGRATQQIISLTNRERTRHGLSALRIDGSCVSAISGHVNDIARQGFLSHTGSDGRGPDQRYRKYSPRSLGSGENLAYNRSGTGAAFMQQWLASPIHRGNILNRKYKGIGVAVRRTCSGKGKERRCTYYAGQCFSL